MEFKRLIEFLRSDDFSRLLAKRLKSLLRGRFILDTMLASEDILRRDWDSPEEDTAWSHL